MNWPSMWEDIQERAAASPPPNRRKLSWKVATSAQKVEFGPMGPGASRRLRGLSQSDREAAQYVKHLLEQRAKRIEARTREFQADLLAWQMEIRDVEPLQKR